MITAIMVGGPGDGRVVKAQGTHIVVPWAERWGGPIYKAYYYYEVLTKINNEWTALAVYSHSELLRSENEPS